MTVNSRWLAVLLLVGILVNIHSCGRRNTTKPAQPTEDRDGAQRLYAQAQTLAQQGALDEAIAACGKAIKLAPSHVPSYLLRADLLVQGNRYHEAVRDWRVAHRLSPNDVNIMLQFLRHLPPFLTYKEMEEVARRAVSLEPRNAEAHFYLGLALVYNPDKAKWSEAERELSTASRFAPWMAQPLIELGRLYIRQRRFGLAQTALETAWNNLTRKGSPLSAALPLTELRIQQRNAAFWLRQVYQHLQSPRAQEMSQTFEKLRHRVEEEERLQKKANAVPPDFDAKLKLAQMNLQDGNLFSAARYAQEVLRQRPKNAEAKRILDEVNKRIVGQKRAR